MNEPKDKSVFLLKKWHLILLVSLMLIGAGVQIGLSLAKFDALEKTDSDTINDVTELKAAVGEVKALRMEIKNLNDRLDLLQNYDITPKKPKKVGP